VNGFGSLIACYLFRLDEQYFFVALSKYVLVNDGSTPYALSTLGTIVAVLPISVTIVADFGDYN